MLYLIFYGTCRKLRFLLYSNSEKFNYSKLKRMFEFQYVFYFKITKMVGGLNTYKRS